MKKKAIKIIAGIVVIAIAIGLISMLAINNQENELSTEDVVLQKNVSVITNEATETEQPYKIDENHLYYKEKPDLKRNSIIVSGITESAPTGYMRKIVSIKKSNGEYVVETIQAGFKDVFKEVDFQGSISLSESSVSQTIEPQSNTTPPVITPLATDFKDPYSSVWSELKNRKIDDKDFCATINGNVDLKVVPKLEVSEDNVIFDVIWDNICDISIYFYNKNDFNKNVQRDLTTFYFLPQEFYIGNVPVVITNTIHTTFNFDGEIKGDLDTTLKMHNETLHGFIYNSAEHSYTQQTDAKSVENDVEFVVGDSVKSNAEMGIIIKSQTAFYEDLSVESSSYFKANIDGDVEFTVTEEEPKGVRNGALETRISADNKAVFTPGYPLCSDIHYNPLEIKGDDYYLWNETTDFSGSVAPGEAMIATQFYSALNFYEQNIYGRDYRITKQEHETPPVEGAVNFNGEWLAPYPHNNFQTYEDFVAQCSEYFDSDTIDAINHEIGGRTYKDSYYSRFVWGIGDWRNSEYDLSIKEIKISEFAYYYEINGSYVNMADERVEVKMNCNYVDGRWVFDSYSFYGEEC